MNRDRLKEIVLTRWPLVLVVFAGFGFFVNLAFFYPGYLTNDSLQQLCQAMGRCAVNDWHPPVMAAVWHALIVTTKHPASMLLEQLSMLWLALALFSIYVFKTTANKRISMLPLGIGFLPYVLNISGVIWKDDQMAFALLLSTSLILWIGLTVRKTLRVGLLSVALVLITYAVLVRYNAIFAAIPLIYWALSESRLIATTRRLLLATSLILACMASLIPLVSFAVRAQATHPLVSTIVDDILETTTPDEIGHSDMPDKIKHTIATAQKCAYSNRYIVDLYWRCNSDSDRKTMQEYYGTMQTYWLKSVVVGHPLRYGLYRIQSFSAFMFPGEDDYVWQPGSINDQPGRRVVAEKLQGINSIYIADFWFRYLPFLFAPWFWAVLSAWAIYHALKAKERRGVILALAGSSLLYVLSYLPTSSTTDYRYIYWSSIATSSCLLILYMSKYRRVRSRGRIKRLHISLQKQAAAR